jgi:hypothetical protein
VQGRRSNNGHPPPAGWPHKNKSEDSPTADSHPVEEIAMALFDPRYQLEAEDPLAQCRRAALSHQEIQRTLHALDRLAWRLRGRLRAHRR